MNDLAAGRKTRLDYQATTFLLDRHGRLWLGADMGEWGGRVTRIDVATGMLSTLKPPQAREAWNGVYGFVELADGQVWAFGGTSHMGMNYGVISRVDEANPRGLFQSKIPRLGEEPDRSRPSMPITHVVEEKDGLFVLSFSDVFRVDKGLKTWKPVTELEIRYQWGRPDAMGSYPSVRALHAPERPGEPYLFATAVDGYVALDRGKTVPHSVPGQLAASGVADAKSTAEGTLFFEGFGDLPGWRLGSKGWEVVSLAPPFEADPADTAPEFVRTGEWYQSYALVGAGGTIYTVNSTSASPGTRTTTRQVNGKSERLGRETSSLRASSCFITGDGTLWNGYGNTLYRFANGKWASVSQTSRTDGPDRLRTVSASGPPWLLIDRFGDELWRLRHGPRGEEPRLTRVPIREGGKDLRIDDAIPWSNGTFLLATEAGLRVLAAGELRFTRADIPEPPEPPSRLVRDGLGRLWLGGAKGLALAMPGSKSLEVFAKVPWFGDNAAYPIARDPKHDDGVIVSLDDRGVAFVRATRIP